jgi:glutamate formiminotransferase
LETLPINYLSLLATAQTQARRTKFNAANLQSYEGQKEFVNSLYWAPKYSRFPVKPFSEVYSFSTSTYRVSSNLASPQLNFRVSKFTNADQSGNF